MIFLYDFDIIDRYGIKEIWKGVHTMFSNLFNYDNPVWRFIGKFWDVLVVNLLWIICSIPIVTIGASTTAMYYVTLRLVRDEDGYTIRSFFKSFKDNFKQATAIWLIFLAVGLILGFDLYFVLTMMAYSTLRTVMTTVFLALLFIWFAMFTFVFPLQSRFYNPVKKTIFNAFFMSIRHVFYTIGIVVMDVVLVLLTLTMIPQLLMFGVALIAFVNSFFLNAVFKKYMPKDDREDDHEMRPLFADEDEAAEEAQTMEDMTGERVDTDTDTTVPQNSESEEKFDCEATEQLRK